MCKLDALPPSMAMPRSSIHRSLTRLLKWSMIWEPVWTTAELSMPMWAAMGARIVRMAAPGSVRVDELSRELNGAHVIVPLLSAVRLPSAVH